MKIDTAELTLDFTVKARELDTEAPAPYDDWFRCEVRVDVPSFKGVVNWRAQAVDFARFKDELTAMHETVGRPGVARLQGLEPGVRLSLRMLETGNILGDYELTDYDGSGPNAPVLRGEFDMDQTYLRPIIQELTTLLAVEGQPVSEQ